MAAKHIALGSIHDNERKPVQFLIDNLPKDYYVVSNGTFRNGTNEIDAVVIAPHAIYSIELKNYNGKITGDQNHWYISGREEKSPIGIARWKAQSLASDLRLYNHELGRIFVQPLVFLTGNSDFSAVNDNAIHRVVNHKTVIDYIVNPNPLHMDQGARFVNVIPYYAQLEEGLRAGLYVNLPMKIREFTIQSVLWKTSEYTAVEATMAKHPNHRILRIYDLGNEILSKDNINQYRNRFNRDKQAFGKLLESLTGKADGHEVVLDVDEPFPWIIQDPQRTLFVCPMKSIEALPLRDEIAKEEEMEFWLRCSIASQLCRGLAFIHRSGVAHRNLHPGNILLENTNKLIHIFNFDHGKISNSVDTVAKSMVLYDLKINEEIYQKRYRAPEFTSGKQEIDWKAFTTGGEYADLYSLGVILCDLFIHPVDYNDRADPEKLPDSLSEKTKLFIKQCLSSVLAERKKMNLQEIAREFSLLADINEGGIIPTLEAGTVVFKNYKIDGLLKRTNMSVTYKAYNHLTGVNVVIKFLNTSNQQQASREIQTSYQLLSHLDRKWASDWIDSDTVLVERGRILPDTSSAGHIVFYIVQEYIDGITLHDYIQSVDLTTENKLELSHNLISAVAAVYNVGYTHRDIKPANFIVPKSPTDGKLKIIDFGMSRKIAEASGMEGHSPGYTPPEVRKGGDWSPLGDVWSAARSVLAIFCGEREDDLNGPKILWEIIQELEWPEFEKFLRDNTQENPNLRDANAQKMLERFEVISAYRNCQRTWQSLVGKSTEEIAKKIAYTVEQASQLVRTYPKNPEAKSLLEEAQQKMKDNQPNPINQTASTNKEESKDVRQGLVIELVDKQGQSEADKQHGEAVSTVGTTSLDSKSPLVENPANSNTQPSSDRRQVSRRNSVRSSLDRFEVIAGRFAGREVPFEILDKDLLETWRSITAKIILLPLNDYQTLQLKERANSVRTILGEIVQQGFRRSLSKVEAALTRPEYDAAFQEAGQWAGSYSLVGLLSLEAQGQLGRAGERFEVWFKAKNLFDEVMAMIGQSDAVDRASELRAEIERRLEQIGSHSRTLENQLTSPLEDEVEDSRMKRVKDLEAEIRSNPVAQKIWARISFERSIVQGENYAAQKEAIESNRRLGIFEIEYFESDNPDDTHRNRMPVEKALSILDARWKTWAGRKLREYIVLISNYHLNATGPFLQNPETLLRGLQEQVTHINRPISTLDLEYVHEYNAAYSLLQQMRNNFLPLKQRLEKVDGGQVDMLAVLVKLDKTWGEIGPQAPVLEADYQQQRSMLISAIPENQLKPELANFKAQFPEDPSQAGKLANDIWKRLTGNDTFKEYREIFKDFNEICTLYENTLKNVEKAVPADSLNVLKDLRQQIKTMGLDEPAKLAELIVKYETADAPFAKAKSLVDALEKLSAEIRGEISKSNITVDALDKVNNGLTEIEQSLPVLEEKRIIAIPEIARLHTTLLNLQRRLQVFQNFMQAWLELRKTSGADLKAAGEELAEVTNIQSTFAVKDIPDSQIKALNQLLAGFLVNDKSIQNAIDHVEHELASPGSDTLEALPDLLVLWNNLSDKMDLPTSLVTSRAETFEKLRARLSSLAKRLIVTINQNPRQCKQNTVEETLKWSRTQQIIQESELNQMEGALQEVRAWNYLYPQLVDGNPPSTPNLKAAYACWKKAESLQRPNATEHRLSLLKIRAFVEARDGDTRPLQEALADQILKQDEEIITLGAQIRLEDAIKKYEKIDYLRGLQAETIEVNGKKVISFAELDRILTSLQNDLGMQNPGAQPAQAEDAAYIHIWHQLDYATLFTNLYPQPILTPAQITDEINYRRSVYLDLVAIFSLVHENGTLSELHRGCTVIVPQRLADNAAEFSQLFISRPDLTNLLQKKWQEGRSQVIQSLAMADYPHQNNFRHMILDPGYYLAYEKLNQQITSNRLIDLNNDIASTITYFRQRYAEYSSSGYITALYGAEAINNHWDSVAGLKESTEDLDNVIHYYINHYSRIPHSITGAWGTNAGNPLSQRQVELNNLINDTDILRFISDLHNLKDFYTDLRISENQCYVVDNAGKKALSALEGRWIGIRQTITGSLRQHPCYIENDKLLSEILKMRSEVETRLKDIEDAHYIDQQDGIHIASSTSLKHFTEYRTQITGASPVEWAYFVLIDLKRMKDAEKTCWDTTVCYDGFRGVEDVERYLTNEVNGIRSNRKKLESIQNMTDAWSTILLAGQQVGQQGVQLVAQLPLQMAMNPALLTQQLGAFNYSNYLLAASWEDACTAFCQMLGLSVNLPSSDPNQPKQDFHKLVSQLTVFLQSLSSWTAVENLFVSLDQARDQRPLSIGQDGLTVALVSKSESTLFGWLRAIYDNLHQIEKQSQMKDSTSAIISQSRKDINAQQQTHLRLAVYKIQIALNVLNRMQERRQAYDQAKRNVEECHTRLTVILNKPWWQSGGGKKTRQEEASEQLRIAICECCAIAPLDRTQREKFLMECQKHEDPRANMCRRFNDKWGDI